MFTAVLYDVKCISLSFTVVQIYNPIVEVIDQTSLVYI